MSSPTCITATTGAAWRRCRIECLADFILVSGLSMFSACLSSSPRSGTRGVCIGHEVDERWGAGCSWRINYKMQEVFECFGTVY